MHKYSVALLLCFLISTITIAQNEEQVFIPKTKTSFWSKLNYGLEFGYIKSTIRDHGIPNFISLRKPEVKNLPCAGFYAGMIARYQEPHSIFVSFDTGISYQKKGRGYPSTCETKLHYLQVPLTINFNFLPNRLWAIYLKAGVYGSTLLFIEQDTYEPEQFKRVELGQVIGIGFNSLQFEKAQVEFWIQRTLGLTPAYLDARYSPGGAPYELEERSASFELGCVIRRVKK